MKKTYRDAAFQGSLEGGFHEYNVSDVDWLFSIGLPRIKIALVMGSKIRAGTLYLSQYCEKLFVIVEDENNLIKLEGIAREEGLKGISFKLAGQELFDSLKGSVDYVCIYEELDKKKMQDNLLFASSLICDSGFVSFFTRTAGGDKEEKAQLKKVGLNYSQTFWAIPSIWRPTWSGNFNDIGSLKLWIDAIDLYNRPSRMFSWLGCFILSRPGKMVLKLFLNLLYPLKTFFLRERCIFAAKQDCFNGQLKCLRQGVSLRKSKAFKEGRVLFFIRQKHEKTVKAVYFSRLKQYEPLLLKELSRNNHSICPVKLDYLDDNTPFLISDFISGGRLNIYNGMDKETILWLIKFQADTRLGCWKDEEWRSFISARTFGSANRPADYFLRLMAKENRGISMVAEHGDFGYLNILGVKKEKCVLDWEYFNERGDEFFDLAYFMLNIYTEKYAKKNVTLREFIHKPPESDYVATFMKEKGIKDADLILCAVLIAALRTKYQSLYHASVKDIRYWVFDSLIERISGEVFSK